MQGLKPTGVQLKSLRCALETQLDEKTFPIECPWSLEILSE